MTNKLIESLAQIQIPRQQPAEPDTCPLCGKPFGNCEYFQSLDEEDPESQVIEDQ